jgi:uncharacterized membrane-anchored protein
MPGSATLTRSRLSRVAEVTVLFWMIKVLSTGMGEATSDFLVHKVYPPAAVIVCGLVCGLALLLQLRAKRYVVWRYWLAIVMVSVFGTMVADVTHVVLGVPYLVSTVFFGVSLAVIFTLWYLSERTLSIHSIVDDRRELFYWATVIATFALGTAAGDMTAKTLSLGWLGASVLFTAVIAIPLIGYRRFGLNAIVAFWFAYIVTRPLGASWADYLGLPPKLGGIGLGRGEVAVSLTLLIVVLVAYLAARQRQDGGPSGSIEPSGSLESSGGVEPRPALATD